MSTYKWYPPKMHPNRPGDPDWNFASTDGDTRHQISAWVCREGDGWHLRANINLEPLDFRVEVEKRESRNVRYSSAEEAIHWFNVYWELER